MADPVAVQAFAKVNLGLVVKSRQSDGFHPLISLVQSISWADRLEIARTEEDSFTAAGIEAADDNLAWRAVEAVRAGRRAGVHLHLEKHIPVAAGLGGGSADAAAALAVAGRLFGVPAERLRTLAGDLGSDVPFCLTGGLAIVEGRGDQVAPQPQRTGYAVALVVPPPELPTPDVYGKWDAMGEPEGPQFPSSALPPGLREFAPLRNDLQPAAEALAPQVAEWRDELAHRWDRPVAMSGSGSALFSFFLDVDEARSALEERPEGSRGAAAAVPQLQGWRMVPGTLADPE